MKQLKDLKCFSHTIVTFNVLFYQVYVFILFSYVGNFHFCSIHITELILRNSTHVVVK